ncbi:MAG: right-handed parallel beta-helix repeat-containing protein [Candidatus Bathyarchaeota archaeon]|nr:right-handed parallel beta-helix repeat-containing protein [Candidatus Bathyarchaeota archaeon]
MRTETAIFILVFLIVSAVVVQSSNLSKANFMPPIPDLQHIYIRNDGTVEPSNAPMQRNGNTYILTRNLIAEYVIEVQMDNAVLDGGSHTIQGIAPSGIILLGRSNIVIKNFDVRKFNAGISIRNSYNIVVTANTISGNDIGIALDYAVNNTISGNVITGNGAAILTYNDCDYNRIMKNQLTSNKYAGIWFESSRDGYCDFNSIVQNTISSNIQEGIMCRSAVSSIFIGNTIADNGYGSADTVDGYGIFLSSSNNTLFLNNFINNREQTNNFGKNNVWDNGSKGNHWSDYNGTDANIDGIGDTAYLLKNAQDNYPLMKPIDTSTLTLPELPVASSISIPPVESTPSPSPSPSPSVTASPNPLSSPTPNPSASPTQQPAPTPSDSFMEQSQSVGSNLPTEPEYFIIAAGVTVTALSAGFLIYFRKRKQ